MKETKDVLRIVGMVLLVLFVLAVGVPLVLAAAGVALGILGFLVGLAVLLIKVAGVVAFIFFFVGGIPAGLRGGVMPPCRHNQSCYFVLVFAFCLPPFHPKVKQMLR